VLGSGSSRWHGLRSLIKSNGPYPPAVPKPDRDTRRLGGHAMKQAMTRELFGYWDEIRGDRLAPERADIDPTDIRGLLGLAFVLEVDGAGRFPFRLSGNRINALFLRELRGASFIDLWRSHEHAEITRLLLSVLDDTAPAVIGATAAPAGYLAVELEVLLLPLRHHGKTHARILGSLAPSMQSSWFGLIAAEPLELHSIRILRPGEPAGRSPVAAEYATQPPAAGQAAPWAAITRRNHLTVYSRRG
jgi:hypothetical protein